MMISSRLHISKELPFTVKYGREELIIKGDGLDCPPFYFLEQSGEDTYKSVTRHLGGALHTVLRNTSIIYFPTTSIQELKNHICEERATGPLVESLCYPSQCVGRSIGPQSITCALWPFLSSKHIQALEYCYATY